MTITTTTLTRAAAVSAMAGGLLFIAVQIKHPHLDATFAITTEYAVRETMKILMAILSLIGITGIYLRQVRQTGMLGLLGYLLFGAGYLAIMSVQIVGVFVLPSFAVSQPEYVNAVFAVATGGTPTDALGNMIRFGGFTFLAGGVVFGIALFRANILPRWAALLLIAGTLVTFAIPLLPQLNQRLFAIPTSVAVLSLGYFLWRDQRSPKTLPSPVSPQLDPTGVQ